MKRTSYLLKQTEVDALKKEYSYTHPRTGERIERTIIGTDMQWLSIISHRSIKAETNAAYDTLIVAIIRMHLSYSSDRNLLTVFV